MGTKKYKPYTPSRRFMTSSDFSEISQGTPLKSLIKPLKKTGGRNNLGRITARFRGGGHKRFYRIIDFKREKYNVPAKVKTIEYDPNRSARIALVAYADGEKRYIIAPDGLKVGDSIISGKGVEVKIGNTLPVGEIPEGVPIHSIELSPGRGAVLSRSAGTSAVILSKEGKYAHVQLPSGEVRLIDRRCMATVGEVSNKEHINVVLGKAGRLRWKGRKPHVRGIIMNPVDHPLGGGEGRSKSGRPPSSPWGTLDGTKTRNKKKHSNKFIIKSRRRK